jgi:nicotinate-nucleotide pyrophosphorylase (carboxylating)
LNLLQQKNKVRRRVLKKLYICCVNLTEFISAALQEDVRDGDHSTLASISPETKGVALLKIKEDCILAGVAIAEAIFKHIEPDCILEINKKDGDQAVFGDIAFTLHAKVHTILTGERLALNTMQRMSGIATLTSSYANLIKDYKCQVLDTRKTTPLFRYFEKEAVRIGGGTNHRFGLYDMIMLKDNHIDFCGGIEKAIDKANDYIKDKKLSLKIEVETRNLDDVRKVLAHGGIDRIMLDNFPPSLVAEAVLLIGNRFETEASGGINKDTIVAYAATGVDFVSVGALIHQAKSVDLSLKAKVNS